MKLLALTLITSLGLNACGSNSHKSKAPETTSDENPLTELGETVDQTETDSPIKPQELLPPNTIITSPIRIASPGKIFDFTNAKALVEVNDQQSETPLEKNYKKLSFENSLDSLLVEAAEKIETIISDIEVSSAGRVLVSSKEKKYLILQSGVEIEIGINWSASTLFTSKGDLIIAGPSDRDPTKRSLFIVRHNDSKVVRIAQKDWDIVTLNKFYSDGQNVAVDLYTNGSSVSRSVFITAENAFMLDQSYLACGIDDRYVLSQDGTILEPTLSGIKTHKLNINGFTYMNIYHSTYTSNGCFFTGVVDRDDVDGYVREEGLFYIDNNLNVKFLEGLDNLNVELMGHGELMIMKNGNILTSYAANGWKKAILKGVNIDSMNLINRSLYYTGSGYDLSESYTGRVDILTGEKTELVFNLGSEISEYIGLE